jgi:hypothetical protein
MATNEHEDSTPPEIASGMVPHDDVDVFLRSWHGVAATLVDRHLTVSGSTPLADALFPNLHLGVNIARQIFLDLVPGEEPDCAVQMSYQVVAALHASLAWHENDTEFQAIIGELSAMSREFASAWAADRQAFQPHGVFRTTQPGVGAVSLRYQLLELAGGSNDILIVWQGADAPSEFTIRTLIPPQ